MKTKEEITHIILKRVEDTFSDGYHNNERSRLLNAIDSINELMPPEQFKQEELPVDVEEFIKDKQYTIVRDNNFMELKRGSVMNVSDVKILISKTIKDKLIKNSDIKVRREILIGKLSEIVGIEKSMQIASEVANIDLHSRFKKEGGGGI